MNQFNQSKSKLESKPELELDEEFEWNDLTVYNSSIDFVNSKVESARATTCESSYPVDSITKVNSTTTLLQFIDYLKKSGEYVRHRDYTNLLKVEPPVRELDKMIGMGSLKRQIIDQILYYVQFPDRNEYLNTVICGNPGCGKSTVATIIAKIYTHLGLLKSPNRETKINFARRDNLIAGYLGQTAIKTKKYLTRCLGGVVVIDEVYQFGSSNNGSGGESSGDSDSFAQECVDTLNQFISEHKNRLIVIIIGYESEIKERFFSLNKGLQRRFQWWFKVDFYQPSELLEMLLEAFNRENYTVTRDAVGVDFFRENQHLFNFTGGDIENFITKCKIVCSQRTFGLPIEDKYHITRADIQKTLEIYKKHKQGDKKIDNWANISHIYL